jgi:hypothetical protein
MMKKFLLLTIASALWVVHARAQTSDHLWGAIFYTAKLTDKWGLIGDIQWRSKDDMKEMSSFIIRPGVSYNFTKQLSASAGYAFIPTDYTHDVVPEHRVWEQLIFAHKNEILGSTNTSFAHRLRMEHRWVPTHVTEHDHDYLKSNRFRYFIRTITPLFSKELTANTFFLSLQNEVFLNLKGSNFDQNRAYLAAGYRFSKKFDGEMGYMHTSMSNNTTRSILQIAGYVRL